MPRRDLLLSCLAFLQRVSIMSRKLSGVSQAMHQQESEGRGAGVGTEFRSGSAFRVLCEGFKVPVQSLGFPVHQARELNSGIGTQR